MKGGFLEIPKALSFRLDAFIRLPREELLGMIGLGWHARHIRAALCLYATLSFFIARLFPDYYRVGFNILGDAFRTCSLAG